MPPRRYDRTFDWVYGRIPEAPSEAKLVPVTWDGLPLNTGDQPTTGLFSIITDVEGWLDSPTLTGNDASRAIADGAAWGPKTLEARTIVLHGAAAGPRDQLGWLRDQLAARAAARRPGPLVISAVDRALEAQVRAGDDRLRVHWLGLAAFTWQATLHAADPLLYEQTWQQVQLVNQSEESGRPYPRDYQWSYPVPYLPNSARLANPGNADAPVWALFTGDLSESRLVSDAGGQIRLAPLQTGMQVRVATASLSAEGEGGISRASYLLPGSSPMTVPAGEVSRWYLYAVGGGSVTLGWRGAWA